MTAVIEYAVQTEYSGAPVPLARPLPRGTQQEYVYNPLTTGPLQNGIVDPLFSRAGIAGTPITIQLTPADLLTYSEISSNSSFDAESKWRFIVWHYLHSASGFTKKIILRKIGAVWNGTFTFTMSDPLGTWTKRTNIIKANTGAELILLPSRFVDGESIVLQA